MTFTRCVPRRASARARAARRLPRSWSACWRCSSGSTAAFAGSHGAPLGRYTTNGAYSFVTAPSLHPPKITTDTTTRPPASSRPGYIFTANFYDLNEPPIVGQSGPLILDRKLQPVWFQPVPERIVAANLSLQTYEGKPVLAWWQGEVTNTGATESGEDVVVNQHYQPVATLQGDGRLGAHAPRVPDRRRTTRG